MAISNYLSPEQLQLMLNNTFGDEQNYVRQNPLQFQYPFIPGGITTQFDPRNFQSIFPTSGIRQQVPLQNLGIDTSYGVANEPDDEQDQEHINQVNQSNNKFGGIMDLIGSIAIPGYGFFKNIARGGLEGLKGFGRKLGQSDFAQSSNHMEFLDRIRNRNTRTNDISAADIQNEMANRSSAVQTNQDRGRGDRPGGANYSAPSKPQRSFSSDYSEAQRARKF